MAPLWPALLMAASAFAAGDCPFAPKGGRYDAESAECRLMLELEAGVARFAGLADIKPGVIELLHEIDPAPDYGAQAESSLMWGPKFRGARIRVTAGFVSCHLKAREAAYAAISHEVGHVVIGLRGERATPIVAGKERQRREEAQADQIGWDLMERSGRPIPRAYGWEDVLGCLRAPDYVSEHGHPSEAVRWIEALRARERAKSLDKSVDVAAPGGWKRVDDQGRAEPGVRGTIRTSDERPFTADAAGRIRLAQGLLWEVPPEYARYFAPGEIVAFETRMYVGGETVKDCAANGLAFMTANDRWDLLPGKLWRDGRPFSPIPSEMRVTP